jgi:MacB-like periplasmic core domain
VEERHRDVRGIPMLEHLIRDVRLGARTLKKSPAFTAVTILTLGLGIGANTAIFSIINTALFQPLPVNRPDELVTINRASAGVPTFSYPDYRDLRDRSTLLAGICIRLAVGATSPHIVRLVLGRAAIVWLVGVGVGTAVSFVGTPMLSPFLLGVSPRDPVVIGLSCGILGLVTTAACWLPTRRALASDPVALFRTS